MAETSLLLTRRERERANVREKKRERAKQEFSFERVLSEAAVLASKKEAEIF